MTKVAACVILSIPLHVQVVQGVGEPRWGTQAIVLQRPPPPFPPPATTVPPITFVIGPPAGPPSRPAQKAYARPDRTLSEIGWCESRDDYTAVSESGKFGGRWQFDEPTWDENAPEGWQGVAPQDAPPEVQDEAAATLYDRRGSDPWPTCG